MSKRREGWSRQRWQDAEKEIGDAVGMTLQDGEQVQQIRDEQIEDSPFQARAQYDDAQIAELAQGMREAGFQGVLFVRPHPDGPRDGRPRFQLLFGHRRRRAWRLLCAERGVACALPAVVREASDRQLLTIGAQENLQREDLNPVEEAQLVVWHQELYYPAGLGEIGRMLGKSEDWAKTRARVAQLPDPLKAVVRRAPALMTGVLEVSRLWAASPAEAQALAEHAEREGLNLRQIRAMVADLLAPPPARDERHDQRVDAPNVKDVTNSVATDGAGAPPPPLPPAPILGARTVHLRSPEQRVAEETERIVGQLRLWEQLVEDPAQREVIGRSCERLLHQLNRIITRLEEF